MITYLLRLVIPLISFITYINGMENPKLAELDFAKDLNCTISKLKYLPNKSPYDTFEQVIDNPNGSFSLNYDVNNLSWL